MLLGIPIPPDDPHTKDNLEVVDDKTSSVYRKSTLMLFLSRDGWKQDGNLWREFDDNSCWDMLTTLRPLGVTTTAGMRRLVERNDSGRRVWEMIPLAA